MHAGDKDFLSSVFPQDQTGSNMANNQDYYNGQSGFSNGHNNQDIMENLLALSSQNLAPNLGIQQQQNTRQNLLESQLKIQQLQQLQQLQQQIFQQQMELLSGSAPGTGDQRFHGLPTPAPSTEIRAQPNTEYVSPMMLQHSNSSYGVPHHSPRFGQHLSNSAPANIAFHMSPLPADLDFDVSPLTSPWLEAYSQQPIASSSSSNKRTASPSDEETSNKPSRKRRPAPDASKKSARGSKSASSTPATHTSLAEGELGAPSPVDLSMPPPAQPAPAPGPNTTFESGAPPGSTGDQLLPVTPASIMNLGRLGVNSSLVPPKSDVKTKGSAKSKRTPAASPSLKAILPAEGAVASQTQPQQPFHVKKSSHKDAEQKRRDSLKTSFDDLRMLLPPIPLPSEDVQAGEPLLPGAMPPRGPPRPGGGPNVNVSKLQLLRCGNNYIRVLKGRVERRDEEIENLRQDIRRLRTEVGEVVVESELFRDLDLVEKSSTSEIMEADEDIG